MTKIESHVRGKGGVRWAKGYGFLRSELHLSASTVRDVHEFLEKNKVFDRADKFLSGVDGVAGGVEQWQEDSAAHPGMTAQEKAFRAGGAGIATGGTDFLIGKGSGAVAGAIVGSFVPVPVVGTVAGAVIGTGIGMAADWALDKTGADDAIRHVGAGVGSAVYEEITDVASAGSTIVDGAADTAGDIWNKVTKWKW